MNDMMHCFMCVRRIMAVVNVDVESDVQDYRNPQNNRHFSLVSRFLSTSVFFLTRDAHFLFRCLCHSEFVCSGLPFSFLPESETK